MNPGNVYVYVYVSSIQRYISLDSLFYPAEVLIIQ